MKNFKKILTILFVSSCFGFAKAQLMVDENGKMGVGIETYDTLHSTLTLNNLGRVDSEVFFTSHNTNTLYVNRGRSSVRIKEGAELLIWQRLSK